MEPLSREHIKDLRMCGELMGAYLRQIRDLEAERDALAEQNRVLREATLEAAEWLESRPDMTEGDAATSTRLREALSFQLTTVSPSTPEAVSGDSANEWLRGEGE